MQETTNTSTTDVYQEVTNKIIELLAVKIKIVLHFTNVSLDVWVSLKSKEFNHSFFCRMNTTKDTYI